MGALIDSIFTRNGLCVCLKTEYITMAFMNREFMYGRRNNLLKHRVLGSVLVKLLFVQSVNFIAWVY